MGLKGVLYHFWLSYNVDEELSFCILLLKYILKEIILYMYYKKLALALLSNVVELLKWASET